MRSISEPASTPPMACFLTIVIASTAVVDARTQQLTDGPMDILTEDSSFDFADVSPAPVLFLDGNEMIRKNPDYNPSGGQRPTSYPLFDELYRQAVLMATRDELGLATRDAWLGESILQGDCCVHLGLEWNERSMGVAEELRILLKTQDGTVARDEFRLVLDTHKPDTHGVAYWGEYAMLTVLETASRTKFADSLAQTLKVRKQPNKWFAKGQVPEDIRNLLDDPSFVPQYLAVRKLHRLLRDDGESPKRLAALVWGYIHLGYLTECYFHPMHEVFKARALLYAARLEAREHDSTDHPGYEKSIVPVALALTGFHEFLAEREDELPASSAADLVEPAWLLLGRPCHTFDLEAFVELAKRPELKVWAPLFYLSHLSYTGNEPETLKLQRVFVNQYPECYRIWLTPSYYWGVNQPLQSRWEQETLLGSTLYQRLDRIDEIPESVRPIVREGLRFAGDSWTGSEHKTRARLLKQLSIAADEAEKTRKPCEMSWQVLVALIRELTFSQAMSRVNGLRDMGAPASNKDLLVDTVEPALQAHRFWDLLAAYHSGQIGEEAEKRLLADPGSLFDRFYRLTDFDFPVWCGLTDKTLYALWGAVSSRLWQNYLMPHARNRFYANIREALRRPLTDESNHTGLVPRVAVSSSNPWMIQYRVEHEWDTLEHPKQVEAWWNAYAAFPEVRRSIALQYAKTGQSTEAIKRISAILDSDNQPDWTLYRALGDAYLAEHDVPRHIATIRRFLDRPELNNPAEIALAGFLTGYYLLSAGRRNEAEFFLKRAAETPTDRGRYALSILMEIQGTIEEAARILCDRVQDNPQAAIEWYWFCLRVQNQDLDSAAASVREAFRPMQAALKDDCLGNVGTMYDLWASVAGREDLRELARRFYSRGDDPYFRLHAWLMEMEAGGDADKSVSFRMPSARDRTGQNPGKPASLESLRRRLLNHGVNGKLTSVSDAEAEQILKDAEVGDDVNILYFLGKHAALCGEEDRAVRFWQRAVRIPALAKNNRNLAVHELRRRGMTADQYRQLSGIKPAPKPKTLSPDQ